MKPMLAETLTEANIHQLKFPVYGSPKFDGFRAFVHTGQLRSRSFKLIPNLELQAMAASMPHGWDGELIVGDPTQENCFGRTSSVVTTRTAPATDVRFFVFDNFAQPGTFVERIQTVPVKFRVMHYRLDDPLMLDAFEAKQVSLGYEGIILRAPASLYKLGRSTMADQGMLKLKRFTDYEGRCDGVEEMYRNTNPAKIDAQGYMDRGSKKEGMVPAGCLGNLLVEFKGQTLRIGQGFTQAMRDEYWTTPPIGKIVKFKCPPGGKPISEGGTGLRPPYVFIGFRDWRDM